MIWKHIKMLIRHKWFVLIAGLRIGGIPIWRLLGHDLSKLLPCELGAYARWFHGGRSNHTEFEHAWLHHQNHNPHHPEYWCERTICARADTLGSITQLRMPEAYIREMIADWLGASRAKTGSWDIMSWLAAPHFTGGASRLARMKFHDSTRRRIWSLLDHGIHRFN